MYVTPGERITLNAIERKKRVADEEGEAEKETNHFVH